MQRTRLRATNDETELGRLHEKLLASTATEVSSFSRLLDDFSTLTSKLASDQVQYLEKFTSGFLDLAKKIEGGEDLSDLVRPYGQSRVARQSSNSHTSSDYGGMTMPNDSNEEPVTSKGHRMPPWQSEDIIAGPSYSTQLRLSTPPVESCSSKSSQPQSPNDLRPIIAPTHDQLPPSPSVQRLPTPSMDVRPSVTHVDTFDGLRSEKSVKGTSIPPFRLGM